VACDLGIYKGAAIENEKNVALPLLMNLQLRFSHSKFQQTIYNAH
jgi:hypothetical protein